MCNYPVSTCGFLSNMFYCSSTFWHLLGVWPFAAKLIFFLLGDMYPTLVCHVLLVRLQCYLPHLLHFLSPHMLAASLAILDFMHLCYSVLDILICDCIWENQLVSEKNKILFNAFFNLLHPANMPPSKFEANLTLLLRVRRATFSSFPLASPCLNDYFRVYTIIDFLANRLVFLNTVTYEHYH